jgi:hypothetical protein
MRSATIITEAANRVAWISGFPSRRTMRWLAWLRERRRPGAGDQWIAVLGWAESSAIVFLQVSIEKRWGRCASAICNGPTANCSGRAHAMTLPHAAS